MDIKSRKIKGYLALSILLILCLIMASAMTIFIPKNLTTALTSTTNATRAGNGEDLWVSSVNQFNGDVFLDITNRICGTKDWNTYIQDNYDTDEYSSSSYGTGSYVVPATTINKSTNINSDNGMVVTLGGLEWIVTSLTLAEDTGDVVMTLLLANNISETSAFYTSSGKKGNTIYSSSSLRANLLASSTFNFFSSGSFASSYLVKPKNIKYQQDQSVPARGINVGSTSQVNHVNDSLKDPTHGSWNASYKYSPADTVNDIRYDAWGEDTLWLPSVSEVHSSNKSIWKLTDNQRKISTGSWLRTAAKVDYNNGYYLGTGGACNYDTVTKSHALRPAIHLNLTEVSKNITIPTITKPTKTEDIKKYWVKDKDAQFDLSGVYLSNPYLASASDWVDVTITGKGMVDGNGNRPDVEIKNTANETKWTVDTAHK
ncbi:MAG: hypothetical protein HDT32_01945, partial [Clostridiales bacterium]|nr:hypothetical protein [Clostridiales bacterium]